MFVCLCSITISFFSHESSFCFRLLLVGSRISPSSMLLLMGMTLFIEIILISALLLVHPRFVPSPVNNRAFALHCE